MNANSTLSIYKKLGFNRTVSLFVCIVRKTFDTSHKSRWEQVLQFTREELDGARLGNGYAQEFALRLGKKIGNYKDALSKDASYPIDQENGPQQTLNIILGPLCSVNIDLVCKLRCAITENIFYLEELCQKSMAPINQFSGLTKQEENALKQDLEWIKKEQPDFYKNSFKKTIDYFIEELSRQFKEDDSKTDYFDASKRTNEDISCRLTEKASTLERRFGGITLSSNYEYMIQMTPLEIKMPWLKDCLINFGCFDGIVASILENRGQFYHNSSSWFRGIEPSISELLEFYVYSLWNLTKGIYQFDEKLLKCLPNQDLNQKIPYYVFKNLPEWCVYVDTPHWNLRGLEPYGYFALLDYDFQKGFVLRILLDLPNQLYCFNLPIQKNVSFNEMLTYDSTTVLTTINEYETYQGFATEAQKKKIGFNVCRNIFKDPRKERNFIPIPWLEISQDVIKYAIPQLLYLCSCNKELSNITNPNQPIIKVSMIHGKNCKAILPSNKTASYITVGRKSGNLITNSDDKKINFTFNDTELEPYIEIQHKAIKRINEEKLDEEKSIETLVTLVNSMSNLLQQFANAEKTLKKQKEENEKITDESIKYLEEIDRLQEKLTQAQYSLSVVKNTTKKKESSQNTKDTNQKIKNSLKKIFVDQLLPTPTECLSIVEEYWSDRVTVLPSAWSSAEEIDIKFQKGVKLLNLLIRLVTNYLDEFMKGGDNSARKVFSDKEYAAKESETVSSSTLMRQRLFCGYEMQRHLKIGVKKDITQTARIYFTIEDSKIIIGYCGKHLDISSN